MQREKIDMLINIDDDIAIIYKDENLTKCTPYTGHYYFEINEKRSSRNFYTWEDITSYLYKRGFLFY